MARIRCSKNCQDSLPHWSWLTEASVMTDRVDCDECGRPVDTYSKAYFRRAVERLNCPDCVTEQGAPVKIICPAHT